MPFTEINLEQIIEEKRTNDPIFEKTWDESREEYRLIREMISIRKKVGLTQTELAEKISSKQQVISRIEKHENHPTLRNFCNILDALGYQLRIVKK